MALQTTPHQAAASFPIRAVRPRPRPGDDGDGARGPAVLPRRPRVRGARERLGRDVEHQGVAVLGITRQGSCGNGVCEIGETCGWFVEKSVVPAPRATPSGRSTANQPGRTTSGTAWSWRRRRPSSAGASRGRSRRRERRSAARGLPDELKPCPAPPGSSEPPRRARRCLPQAGQCDCFPGRGWTARGVRRVRRGSTRGAGSASENTRRRTRRRRGRRRYIFPPRPPARTGKSPATLALALAGVAVAAVALCFAGSAWARSRGPSRDPAGGSPGPTRAAAEEPGSSPRFSRAETLPPPTTRARSEVPPRRNETTRRRAKPFRRNRSGSPSRSRRRAGSNATRSGSNATRSRPTAAADFDFDREGTLTLPAPRDDATDLRLAEASRRSYARRTGRASAPARDAAGPEVGPEVGPAASSTPRRRTRPRFLRGARVDRPRPALTDPNAERLRPARRPHRREAPARRVRPGQVFAAVHAATTTPAPTSACPPSAAARRRSPGAPVPPGGRRRGAERRDAGLPPSRGVVGGAREAPAAALAVALAMRRPTRGGGRGEGRLGAGPPPRGGGARSGRDGSVGGVRLVFCRGGTPFEEERMMEERMMEERMMEEELTRGSGGRGGGYIPPRGVRRRERGGARAVPVRGRGGVRPRGGGVRARRASGGYRY